MNKICARCEKIVYPIEELKCLDKTWHKTCFKCTECGMALNMKTYKGYNKLPYCEAHIPKAKATAIADTPELKRIAENTKIQSNVKYHADFEKAKGKFTQVADDPETLRIKQNTKIISNVAYHGDLAKKAAMEKQREATEVADGRGEECEYFSETLAAEQFSQYAAAAANATSQQSPPQQLSPPLSILQQQQQQQQQLLCQQQHTLPSLPIQHPQQNYEAIIASSQAPTTQMYTQNNRQQQQQKQHQLYMQQAQQQQQQHYQQPQALKQHYQQQQQQQPMFQSATTATNQSSHLYSAASSLHQQQKHPATGHYQQQQPQPQPQPQQGNNYNQLRSSILQNSHHPTGASLASEVIPASNTAANAAFYSAAPHHEQFDAYGPAMTYNNNVHNKNNNNAAAVYQQQQHQPTPPPAAAAAAAPPAAQPMQQLYPSNSFSSHTSAAAERTASHHSNGAMLISNSNHSMANNGSSHNNANAGGLQNPAAAAAPAPAPAVSVGVVVGGGGSNSASNIGKIADYDPLTDGPRQMPSTGRPSTTLIYSSDGRGFVSNAYPKRVGSIADIDPANGFYGSITGESNVPVQQQQQQQYYQQMQAMQQQRQHEAQMQQQKPQQQTKSNLRIYRALYDYTAQDVDEVSFREGDVIFEVESIDSGWMTGKVERTGKTGMLPANYVEQAVI